MALTLTGARATHTDDLSVRTAAAGCEIGLAFDGDADRLIMADAKGHVYNGDELLYVIARSRIGKGVKVWRGRNTHDELRVRKAI